MSNWFFSMNDVELKMDSILLSKRKDNCWTIIHSETFQKGRKTLNFPNSTDSSPVDQRKDWNFLSNAKKKTIDTNRQDSEDEEESSGSNGSSGNEEEIITDIWKKIRMKRATKSLISTFEGRFKPMWIQPKFIKQSNTNYFEIPQPLEPTPKKNFKVLNHIVSRWIYELDKYNLLSIDFILIHTMRVLYYLYNGYIYPATTTTPNYPNLLTRPTHAFSNTISCTAIPTTSQSSSCNNNYSSTQPPQMMQHHPQQLPSLSHSTTTSQSIMPVVASSSTSHHVVVGNRYSSLFSVYPTHQAPQQLYRENSIWEDVKSSNSSSPSQFNDHHSSGVSSSETTMTSSSKEELQKKNPTITTTTASVSSTTCPNVEVLKKVASACIKRGNKQNTTTPSEESEGDDEEVDIANNYSKQKIGKLRLKSSVKGDLSAKNKNGSHKGWWTEEEHQRFLEGLEACGNNWKLIAEKYVKTRSRTQVASHGQKWKQSQGLIA
ncbi:predicted protein [Naegleria gruberi]|uniref:Predicted protein n=1 Tax=Naegleria gruberi TaxID=5762 RepID=D2VDT5_NAEGR|nr:uncharacterized protein NAEGRDRAFT_48733 [Naegleria gruberi]EFC45055.1 predicted protein [Naegleria gruberi]|eukprot:XP_002677799.1 predicted protein [Naegleria gruberi strain NEG-M]